jgi:RND superfamily putative drug exporter
MRTAWAIISLPSGRRAKWVVLAFWLTIAAVALPFTGKLMGIEKNDAQSSLPATAESTKVLNLQARLQPRSERFAVIVYSRATGLTAADRAKVAADVREFARLPVVLPGHITGPVPARDGRAMQVVLVVSLPGKGSETAVAHAASALRSIAKSSDHGMTANLTGPLGFSADSNHAFAGLLSTVFYAALAVVIILLLITYRSPVLWLLPVLSVGLGLTTAQWLVYLAATHTGLVVNTFSVGILYVLVFGAGTDYALLLTARYREELRKHADRHEAMAIALRRAFPAILASSATVILAMMTFVGASLTSTRGFGPVLGIGVSVAVLAMLTLLPALLLITGRWVFWPRRPEFGSAEPTRDGAWARLGQAMSARPRLVWVGTAVGLGAVALGLTGLQAHGLTHEQAYRTPPDSVVGEQVLAAHFPGGAGEPVIVVGRPGAAVPLEAAVRATSGLTAVTPPRVLGGYAIVEATLTSPPDNSVAYATIDRLRAAVHAVPGAGAIVGGNTAINLDFQRASAHDRRMIIPIVLGVVLLILILLLRALIAPLILIGTVVLSFAASLGFSALVFNHLFGFGGADSSYPLFAFVFLVALGIDYNIFLMTRVREEAARVGPRPGAVAGLAATGGVITSAGCVLAGTFAILDTAQLTELVELGFTIAFGVLLDTIVVRSVLVTALNLDLGRWMWWPSRLFRLASDDIGGLAQGASESAPVG